MEFNVPPIVGKDTKRILRDVERTLLHFRNPIALVGPTGGGKTLVGLHVLNWYAEKKGVPAYYLQMSPDVSRTTLIGGFRLVQGTLKPVKGVVMHVMDEGGIGFFDEFTHAETEDQASLNSAFNSDRVKISSIGELSSTAKSSTRFIIAHNPLTYLANNPMPIALRRRLISFYVDFPSQDDELQIAKAILSRESPRGVPDPVVRYLMYIARTVRTEEAPICASNVATACGMLAMEHRRAEKEDDLDNLLPEQSTSEPVTRALYKAVHWKEAERDQELAADEYVVMLIRFMSTVSVERFTSLVLNAFMGSYLSNNVRSAILGLIPKF